MKVLLVSRGFPPRSRWGTEAYTHQLALGLRARGHEVHVLHPVREGSRPLYEIQDVEEDGFPVHLVNVREEGSRTVLAVCPFIQGWIHRHQDYADLLYRARRSTVTD